MANDLPKDPFAQVSPASLARHKQLKANAQKLVSQTFYGTLLKQMNSSPFRSELFSGGRGQQAFFPMLAQNLADRMSHGAGGKLPAQMASSMEGKAKYELHERYIKAGRDTAHQNDRASFYGGRRLDVQQ